MLLSGHLFYFYEDELGEPFSSWEFTHRVMDKTASLPTKRLSMVEVLHKQLSYEEKNPPSFTNSLYLEEVNKINEKIYFLTWMRC